MWSKRIKGKKEEKCCRVGSLRKKKNDQYTFLAKVARKRENIQIHKIRDEKETLQ